MEELTIEEKAKRYDEAIERAEKWRNAPNVDKISTFANRVIDEIFPEFEENEDERIREELMQYLWNLYHKDFCPPKPSIDTCDRWIAWLEKQDEKNTAWSEEDEDNFARVDYACLKVYGGDSYSSDWLRKFLGIHKKWKPSEEMLKALDIAVRAGIQLGSWEEKALKELQKQLKAL